LSKRSDKWIKKQQEVLMIIVTGANGQLGRAVVERLLERVPVEQVGVSVRDPEKARGLKAWGVRVRPGYVDRRAMLADRCLAGAVG
jgi:NAD(P)H dehydrogenase (quinone)